MPYDAPLFRAWVCELWRSDDFGHQTTAELLMMEDNAHRRFHGLQTHWHIEGRTTPPSWLGEDDQDDGDNRTTATPSPTASDFDTDGLGR